MWIGIQVRYSCVVLAMLAFIIVGCSSGDEAAEGASSGSTAAAPAPTAAPEAPAKELTAKVKRLVLGNAIPSGESNNPWRYENPRTPWYFAPSHESLIGADADTGEHIPQ